MNKHGQLRLSDLIPFGKKHKGDQVEDLIYDDPSYLAWCVNEEVCEFDDEVIKQLEDKKII